MKVIITESIQKLANTDFKKLLLEQYKQDVEKGLCECLSDNILQNMLSLGQSESISELQKYTKSDVYKALTKLTESDLHNYYAQESKEEEEYWDNFIKRHGYDKLLKDYNK